MINPYHLRDLVIMPTLQYLEPEIEYSDAAVELLMMTAAHESKLGTYLKQLEGPARGIYQMELVTEKDIISNYLKYRDPLMMRVMGISHRHYREMNEIAMIANLTYATAMARVHYYRDPMPIPDVEDKIELANYCKRVWNTSHGKATSRQYYDAYMEMCM